MSPKQKKDLTGTIKQKGKDLYDKYVLTEVKTLFEKRPK
jgi:hypothetical protein